MTFLRRQKSVLSPAGRQFDARWGVIFVRRSALRFIDVLILKFSSLGRGGEGEWRGMEKAVKKRLKNKKCKTGEKWRKIKKENEKN